MASEIRQFKVRCRLVQLHPPIIRPDRSLRQNLSGLCKMIQSLHMKKWQFWLGVLISLGFLYWVLSKVEWGNFWETVTHARYIWLLPGIAVYFIGVWVRAWRWHYLLGPIKQI